MNLVNKCNLNIILIFNFSRIHPKYSLLTHKVNNKKSILVWLEIPPVSEEDISRILQCTTITKGYKNSLEFCFY